jgi:hypothetical protein
MEPLGLPLRVDDRGWLVRSSPKRVLLDLIRVMALTPEGTWPPDPEFGMRSYFESAWRTGLPQRAVDALNRSLERLGVFEYRVTAIEKIANHTSAEVSYSVEVVSSGRGQEFLELRL